MHVTVLEEIPEDPQLIASWNALALGMERPEVFYTHQWALAASKAFAHILRPLTMLVYEGERLCGLASFATRRDSPHHAFFLTASTADYCDILSDSQTRGVVLAAAFDELQKSGVRNITLANVPSESATHFVIPQVAHSHGFHVHDRAAYECGVIRFGSEEERQGLLQSVRRKDRENRGLKKMQQLGPVRMVHSTEASETELEPIVSAQIARFLVTHRLSPLIHPERRQFLIELTRFLSQAGWLQISRLELNGAAMAWNYGFRFAESWFWYLPTFQIQYEQFSPGSCLLQLMIQEGCMDAAVKRLDLGLGEEGYKRRFANATFRTRHIELSESPLRYVASLGRYWLASSARKSPAFEQLLRDSRYRLQRTKQSLGETGVAGTAGYLFGRMSRTISSNDEVFLFESPAITTGNAEINAEMANNQHTKVEITGQTFSLWPIDWGRLAEAAIANADDPQTLQYLIRCAERLKLGAKPGYVLESESAPQAHFLWVSDFEGFHLSEIDYTLTSTDLALGRGANECDSSCAAMIFDCWTPAQYRGRGYYAIAIRLVAAVLKGQEKRAWIFSGARNHPSTRGILNAGFLYRFSLVRKRRWMHSDVGPDKNPDLQR